MSAEPALIDTNVLVYALFAQRPEHAASLALLESAQEPAANLVVAPPQNLAEFYAVVTNPRRVSTPLSGAAARAEVEKFTLLAGLRVLDVPSDVVGRWQAFLGRYPVTGRAFYVGRRLQEVDVTDDNSRLRIAWGLVPATSALRRGNVEGLDVGGQSATAQDTERTDLNFVVGSEKGLE